MAIKGMMKKRHVQVRDYSPINALPTEQIEVDHGGQNNEHFGRKQTRNHTKLTKWAPRCVVISILFFGMLGFRNSMETLHDLFIKPNDRLLYGPPSNATTKFTSLFEDMLTSDKTLGRGDFVPLVLDNGKLLCRRRHKRQISWFRSRMFINMVREGLKSKNPPNYGVDGGLPIIMIEGDYPFCNVAEKKDDIQIPRLAWSMLSPKHGNWCKAISIPSYESWFSYHRTYKSESDWIRTFQQNEKKYPWFGKIDKAVWRGSSTYEISQFGRSAFSEIPRARLVKESMENPDLIDAGFTKINQKFASDKKVLASETNVAKSVWFKDMMKYKGVYIILSSIC